MANIQGYDASEGKTMDERDALPAGEYIAAMVKSEKKDARKQGNAYINCEFEVTDGEFSGRRFWTMLNLWNSNSEAVEIAQRELNSICHATGKLRVNDTEELHGIPMRVKLKVQNDEQYGPQNRVTGYKPMNAGPSAGSSSGSAEGAAWRRTA